MGFIKNVLNLPEIALPSNPVAGFRKLFVKSDGKAYLRSPAGVESELLQAADPVVTPVTKFVWDHFFNTPATAAYGVFRVSATTNIAAVASSSSAEMGVWALRSGTAANTIDIVYSLSSMFLPNSFVYEAKFSIPASTDLVASFGFTNRTATTQANNEICFRIAGTTLSGACDNGGAETVTASTYTTSQSTHYIANITIANDRSSVTFKVYGSNGALLWSDTITTNIIASSIAVSVKWLSYKSTATASTTDLVRLDYMGYGSLEGFKREFGRSP